MIAAVVTGAASGIGRSVSERLAAGGMPVYGLDRTPFEAASFTPVLCDVGDEPSVARFFAGLEKEGVAVGCLVNVAGVLTVNGKTPIPDITLQDWEAMLRNNLTSMFLMIKYAYPLLKKAEGASVVNISSDQSFEGHAGFAPYGVSKAGVNRLTDVAAKEFSADGIRVNAVAPGSVRTNILSTLFPPETIEEIYRTQGDGILLPGDVAELVCYLASPTCRVTGQVYRMELG